VAVVRQQLSDLDAGEELLVVGEGRATEASIRRACERRGFVVRKVSPPDWGERSPSGEESFSLRIRVTEFASL